MRNRGVTDEKPRVSRDQSGMRFDLPSQVQVVLRWQQSQRQSFIGRGEVNQELARLEKGPTLKGFSPERWKEYLDAAKRHKGGMRTTTAHPPLLQVPDPWQLRARFLELGEDDFNPKAPVRLVEFLDDAGYLHDVAPDLTHVEARFRRIAPKHQFKLPSEQSSEWQAKQRFLKRWLEVGPTGLAILQSEFPQSLITYVTMAGSLTLSWEDGRPILTLHCANAWEAMCTTVHWDHLQGIRFQTCARPGCTNVVPQTTARGHARKYCAKSCGAAVRMAKMREKKAK